MNNKVLYFEAVSGLFKYIKNMNLTITRIAERRETPWGAQIGVFVKPTKESDEILFLKGNGRSCYPVIFHFESEIVENGFKVGDTGIAVRSVAKSGNEYFKFKKISSTSI